MKASARCRLYIGEKTVLLAFLAFLLHQKTLTNNLVKIFRLSLVLAFVFSFLKSVANEFCDDEDRGIEFERDAMPTRTSKLLFSFKSSNSTSH